MYAQYRVFRLTHQAGIKVMLDGQGADEMLAGYRYFLSARIASLFRQRSWVEAYRFLNRASKLPGAQRSALLMGAAGLLLPAGGMLPSGLHRIARLRRRAHRSVPDWLNAPWFEERGVTPPTPPPPGGRDVLQGQLHKSLLESSLPALLRYEDRNSMAFSIESRVPFLTADLAEFILSLPEKYIVASDGTSKSVFRQAMRGIVPDVVLDRRDKIGFATPEHLWLTTLRPWVEGVLYGDTTAQVPGLNLPAVRLEWEAILSGRRFFDWRVWRWLNLIRWSQNFEVSF
jgi:asparagine synthase (glutamine-hydrolysing)